MTGAVFAAGAPAPEVFGEVILEGRFGIVLQRFDGPTLLQLSRSGAMTRGQAGAILADLCRAVHKTPPPPGVLSLRDWMDAWLRSAGGTLPEPIATGILALIERLQPADELCHGDLHPGNVIMTAEGPRLVDWSGAVRAPAAFDLAVGHILLTELAPEVADDPERPRAVNAAAQSEYARLAGMSPAALTAAMEPYLPIVRVLIVLGGRDACPAGAAAPARRSGPAPGGLNRAWSRPGPPRDLRSGEDGRRTQERRAAAARRQVVRSIRRSAAAARRLAADRRHRGRWRGGGAEAIGCGGGGGGFEAHPAASSAAGITTASSAALRNRLREAIGSSTSYIRSSRDRDFKN